ncbi:MAG: fumarate hydratase [Candidatus Krumholzibacteria bacterium]|nr:fumarate hydratase [Candidatus Krumholzibacteria bacterium]
MKRYPKFRDWVVELLRRASTDLPEDVVASLEAAREREEARSPAHSVLVSILRNVEIAREKSTPLCQDTGTNVFLVYHPLGVSTREMAVEIREAVAIATEKSYLRPNSVDSVTDKNTGDNLGPGHPYLHFEEWDRDEIWVRVMLKGGGCENVGAQYSLPDARLSAGRDLKGVEVAVLDAINQAQGKGCGPGVIGVCIGGDRAASLSAAKQQHFRKLDDLNPDAELAALEARLMDKANRLGIGPMGFGGKTTTLAVKATAANRLPASFFVSVSYMCWECRRRDMWIRNGEMAIE